MHGERDIFKKLNMYKCRDFKCWASQKVINMTLNVQSSWVSAEGGSDLIKSQASSMKILTVYYMHLPINNHFCISRFVYPACRLFLTANLSRKYKNISQTENKSIKRCPVLMCLQSEMAAVTNEK